MSTGPAKRTRPVAPSAPPAPIGDGGGIEPPVPVASRGCCGKSGGGGNGGSGRGCCNRCFEKCVVCTATLTRVCLIIPNLVFLLFGGTLIGLGVWMRADRESSFYFEVLRALPASPLITFDKVPVVIIAVGSCVAILSFLGCCGACAESICFLCIYMLLLVILLLTEVVLGIVVVAMRNQIIVRLESTMQDQIKFEYSATELRRPTDNRTTFVHHFTDAWDTMQIEFDCCGAIGPEDYAQSAWYNHTKATADKRRIIPLSCCYQTKPKHNNDNQLKRPRGGGGGTGAGGGAGGGGGGATAVDKSVADCQLEASKFFSNPVLYRQTESSTALKTQGCRESMIDLLKQNVAIVIGAISSVAMLQVADCVFACVLMRFVRKKQETWYADDEDYANDDCAD